MTGRSNLTSGRNPVDRRHDLFVPTKDDGRVDVEQVKSGRDDADSERSGNIAPDLCPPPRGQSQYQVASVVLDPLREPLPYLGQTKGGRERIAMAAVFWAIERQHARPHHLGSREAGIIDGEGFGIPHHFDAQVTTGHQPATESGHPRNRLGFPQPGEMGVRVAMKLLEGKS